MQRQWSLRLLFSIVFFCVIHNHSYSNEVLQFSGKIPSKISEWNLFVIDKNILSLNNKIYPYWPRNTLFTDYATKYRTVWIPNGTQIKYKSQGPFEFPIGSVLSKTFAYSKNQIRFSNQPSPDRQIEFAPELTELQNHVLIETRILVKTTKGWLTFPYLWNKDQTDADLAIIGKSISMELNRPNQESISFNYKIPNMNQCKGCHIYHEGHQKTIRPIGPTAIQLNHSVSISSVGHRNQLSYWIEIGILGEAPPMEDWPFEATWDQEISGPLEQRARAYLHANCAHCHNTKGPANTSGLFLHRAIMEKRKIGICKSPVAAGNAGGGLPYDVYPGHPQKSLISYRMNSTLPQVMMPEIGRSLIHKEGVDLINAWITNLKGNCK